MILAAAALAAALASAAAPSASDAPRRAHLLALAQAPEELPLAPVTLEDAPTTPGQAFGASVLTSTTGLAVLIGLSAGPVDPSRPSTAVSSVSRLVAGLLLLSVGPSMGDLLNHDVGAFLAGAGGRTAMVAAGVGAVALAISSGDPLLLPVSLLVVTLGALIWTGWAAADLVRSAFAPERWVERQNAPFRPPRAAPRPPLRY